MSLHTTVLIAVTRILFIKDNTLPGAHFDCFNTKWYLYKVCSKPIHITYHGLDRHCSTIRISPLPHSIIESSSHYILFSCLWVVFVWTFNNFYFKVINYICDRWIFAKFATFVENRTWRLWVWERTKGGSTRERMQMALVAWM